MKTYSYSRIRDCYCVNSFRAERTLNTFSIDELDVLCMNTQQIETRVFKVWCCGYIEEEVIHCNRCRYGEKNILKYQALSIR